MWTYRVVKRIWPTNEVTVGVHEVYDDGDIEHPHSLSESPILVSGESLDDLRAIHERIAFAIQRPVLDYLDFTREE
jgi:hypothetical protein